MVVHLFLNNNKALDFLPINSIKNGGITKQIQQSADQNLTVGTVQREIRIGMSTADVIAILGSPNIVTTDAERREVWVYDKISTETAYSQSNVGGSILILGASASSGAKSTSQKTLTVIIKFDAQSKVRDFAYHTSKF